MNVDSYIDDAKRAKRLKSDRELDRFLDFRGTAVNAWRMKRAWPSDDTMVKLAEAGGHDARRALLDLNLWRTSSTRVRLVYQAIVRGLAGTATALAMLVGASVEARTNAQQFNTLGVAEYALCAIRRWRPLASLTPMLSAFQRLVIA